MSDPTPPNIQPKAMLVNNTGENVAMFSKELFACIEAGEGTPKDLEDVMVLKHIMVDGQKRGILNWA